MEYNTQRDKLKITAYGRTVCKLIDQAKQLPTKDQRTIAAETIVKVMARVNPSVRNTENYKRELWEHMMIMANWELDVDCPYPLERKDEVSFQPRPIFQPRQKIRFRHYGHCLESMIKRIVTMPEGPEKEMVTAMLIAQMKKDYMIWNRTVQERTRIDEYSDIVLRQLDELSEGQLKEGRLVLDVHPFLAYPMENNNKNKFIKKKKKKR